VVATTRVHGLADLQDDPIPLHDVLSGQPRARSHSWAVSADRTTTHWLWDCTAGSFRWWFAHDESVCIVEGSVRVQVDGDEPVTLNAGDAAYFPAGRWSTWTVDAYVRKHAVVRVPLPRSIGQAARTLGQRRYAR
jgi:uncharacterized cupin superfamily protein